MHPNKPTLNELFRLQRSGNRVACLVEGPLNSVEVFSMICNARLPVLTTRAYCDVPWRTSEDTEAATRALYQPRFVKFVMLSTIQWKEIKTWMQARGFTFDKQHQLAIPREKDQAHTWDGGPIPASKDRPSFGLTPLFAFELASSTEKRENLPRDKRQLLDVVEYRKKVLKMLTDLGLRLTDLKRSKLAIGANPIPISRETWNAAIPGEHMLYWTDAQDRVVSRSGPEAATFLDKVADESLKPEDDPSHPVNQPVSRVPFAEVHRHLGTLDNGDRCKAWVAEQAYYEDEAFVALLMR
jgi:hypothetical protein